MSSKVSQPNKNSRGGNAKRLNTQQKLFVDLMLANEQMNPTESARLAGYKTPSQSANSLMKHPVVSKILGKQLKERMERLGLKQDVIIKHLANVLFLDPLEVLYKAPDGGYYAKDLADIPEAIRRCMTKVRNKKIKVEVGKDEEGKPIMESRQMFEIEFMSKDSALPLAMKHFGMLDGKPPEDGLDEANVTGLIARLLGELGGKSNVVDQNYIEGKVLKIEGKVG